MTAFKRVLDTRVVPLLIKYLQDNLSEAESAELTGYIGDYSHLWDHLECMYDEHACDTFRMRREARLNNARLFVGKAGRRIHRRLFRERMVTAVKNILVQPFRSIFI